MKYNLKIIIRNLIRNPVFGFVTIAGFALSLAVALLLASYIFNEISYDKSFPRIERIYRLGVDKGITTFRGDKIEDIRAKYPEIECICRYDNGSTDFVYEKAPFTITNLVKTDNDFFRIFSLKIISGDQDEPLPDDNSIAISSSMAGTIFGEADPIGKTINIMHRKDFTVAAVYNDLPEKSSIKADAVITWGNVNGMSGEWRNNSFYSRLFFLLNDKCDPVILADKLTQDYSQDHYMKRPFRLLPFKKSYLSPLTMGNGSQTLHADLQSMLLFIVVTILILVISVLNFVILFTSNHLSRIKEIGIRKVTGAGRKEIFRQFIFEAVIVSFIAFILGIYLSFLLEKPFGALIDKELPALIALRFPNILLVIPGVIVIGILAGYYPAVIISKYRPAFIFGDSAIKGKLKMKNGLSVLQYLISIVMIISLIIMTRQNSLLTNKDIGFTKEQLINISIPIEIKNKLPVMKEKLLSDPYIVACTVSHGIPGKVSIWGLWNNEAREKYNYEGNLPSFTVDPDFFKVYDAEFIQGRGFLQNDWGKSVVINESAFKLTGWETIEGKVLRGIPTPEQAFGGASPEEIEKNSLNVVGVIRDINVEKLNQPVAPTVFECSDHYGISYLTCRIMPGNYSQVINNIKKVWNETCPDSVFEFRFYDEWINTLYDNEKRTAFIIRIFAFFSIVLSCLGTFGIIDFISRQKTKEIGVRKVHGAKIIDVIRVLNWSIVKWIVIAYLIAVPLSYAIMWKYLQAFAYKTMLSWWIFALAGLFTLGTALLTISWQSWKAATRNPVEALRYE
jgi:putative ABC transport system permease protein